MSVGGGPPAAGSWTRVYLYTGANDSAPHKPIGDLLNRATFVMPPPQSQLQQSTQAGGAFQTELPLAQSFSSPLAPPQARGQQLPLARLVIEEPKLSDEALYKCDVTYVKGKCPSISLVRLQMVALPERAQILQITGGGGGSGTTQANKQTRQPLAHNQMIGPLSELDQLRLVCLIRGGRPAPRAVFWRKIDLAGRTINLPASEQTSSLQSGSASGKLFATARHHQEAVEVTLNHTLTSDDLGAKFECHVEHEALEGMRPTARIISTTTAGGRAPKQAQPDAMLDLHPAASSINRHDGEPTGPDGNNNDDDDGEGAGLESRLHAESAQASLDSHVIVDLNVGVSSLDLFLTKLSGAQLQHSLLGPNGKRNASEPLHEGDLIELECVAYNSKPAANITWLNGPDAIGTGSGSDEPTSVTTSRSIKTLPGGDHHRALRQRRLLQRNQVKLNPDGHTYNTHSFLSIKLSRHEHRAQISCQAQNGLPRQQQPIVKSIELQVQHAPIVLMEPAAGITVSEFDVIAAPGKLPPAEQPPLVQIYCIYSANPFQLVANSVRWFKDGQPLAGHQVDRLVESFTPTGYPVLAIKQVSRTDAGRYDCQLANSAGTSERLPSSEACKLEVNFRPSVALKALRRTSSASDGETEGALAEIAHLEQELVLPGDEFVLVCQVLEAQPSKINKFHWFSRASSADQIPQQQQHQRSGSVRNWPMSAQRPLAVTEGPQLKLSPMQANFTPTSYACTASNSIGQSDPSEPIDLQLSHTPGPSQVRSVTDPSLRKIILGSGKGTAPQAGTAAALTPAGSVIDQPAGGGATWLQQEHRDFSDQPISAGRELLLECLTQDLGRPRANIWLWFKDGQTIESSSPPPLQQQQAPGSKLQQQDEVERIDSTSSTNNNHLDPNSPKSDFILQDNPISDRLQDLTPPRPPTNGKNNNRQVFANDNVEQKAGHHHHNHHHQSDHHQGIVRPRLLASGRYLFIPSIQLAHRGNYSCVAVNRLGTGSSPSLGSASSSSSPAAPMASLSGSQSTQSMGRDSYQLRVALAPSFVQPLPTRTYWPETSASSQTMMNNNGSTSHATGTGTANVVHLSNQSNDNEQLELVCHVQCEPICHIEWLRNNEPIDVLASGSSSSGKSNNNFLGYSVRHTIMDENEAANLFRSIESKLVLSFHAIGPPAASGSRNSDHSLQANGRQGPATPLIDRDKLLERRHFLNNSNFTCQSSPNSMGGPVKSTTIFSVQYPPENVLISAPSDKLNLVEGSNGPLLSCEAAGEPQVQYRWLLLRSGNNIITSSDLVAARYNMKHFGSPSQQQTQQDDLDKQQMGSVDGVGAANRRHRTPRGDQANDGQYDQVNPGGGGGAPALLEANGNSQRFVELTGLSSGEQVGGTMISTLDLSSISIDRKQAGHYICEASNKLGQTRQSVYVNVLYKPTCTTLHMHSLDSSSSTQETLNELTRGEKQPKPSEDSESGAGADGAKPFGASANDEYAIIRETSGDFIDLRRVLVISPLLNRHSSPSTPGGLQDNQQEPLSFSGSIFGSILDSGKRARLSMSDGAALHHGEESKDELSNSISSDLNQAASSDGGDSWAKFNSILLKFLNNYSRQIKQDEDRRAARAVAASRRNQQTRRSSAGSQRSGNEFIGEGPELRASPAEGANAIDDELDTPSRRDIQQRPQTRHLLTFVCMAQEGNPLSNLTFDWYFGGTKLPQADERNLQPVNDVESNSLRDDQLGELNMPMSQQQHQRPISLYSSENLTISMTRRLDTKTILNPFQMSFLTIKIISSGDLLEPSANSASVQDPPLDKNKTMFMRAPVIKSRYQSLYSPKANGASEQGQQQQQQFRQQRNNNIQFGQEFNSAANGNGNGNDGGGIDLNALNWQDKLGSLLSCSSSNAIGTSEASYVRINLAERAGRSAAGASGNSLYEFAKWRMPSLAQKSLLIISVLIGCALIVFLTFALLVGPHIRAMHFLQTKGKSSGSGSGSGGGSSYNSGSSKDETGTNTGQSTCSQKSSVLGLLCNAGDSSFPGSSDDDTSARLNGLDSNLIAANGNLRSSARHNQNANIVAGGGHRLEIDDSIAALQTSSARLMPHSNNNSIDYDQPRNTLSKGNHAPGARLIYQPDVGNFNISESGYENYRQGNNNLSAHNSMQGGPTNRKSSISSTSGRILASLRLKPFSRSKIQDRLSDLPNITGRFTVGSHNRNVSNSETATTGVSVDNESSYTFGMPNNLRHSYGGGRPFTMSAAAASAHRSGAYVAGPPPPVPAAKPDRNSYAFSRDFPSSSIDDATSNRLMQINSQALLINPSSLMSQHQQMPNAMDEFMRSRGLDTTGITNYDEHDDDDTLATTYGSQSIRNQSSTLYSLRNDLEQANKNHNKQSKRNKPPVFPRSTTHHPAFHHHQQYQSSTMFKPPPPPVAARALQRQIYQSSSSNHFAPHHHPMYPIQSTPYSESFIMQQHQQFAAPSHRMNIFDNHSNNLLDSAGGPQLGYYPGQDQHVANYANTFDLRNPYNKHPNFYHDEQSPEHIYDLNAYATPEQTPLRKQVAAQASGVSGAESTNDDPDNQQSDSAGAASSERPRVSQLIQTFSTQLPDQSP